MNQRKGENDRRKYFTIILYERMLPTSAGAEPPTWSPVGLSHQGRPNGVGELDSERTEELTGQLNDAFNKTEYNEVPLTRRSAPFMDSIVVSTEE